MTLPGVSTVSAVSIFAETDPIATFNCPDQRVAFAGLGPAVFQTGQYDAPGRHISKRGPPHLRRTLWLMALGSILHPGPLSGYYKRRRAAGLHHLSAVTAVALKLCRFTWRILTDQRDYTPELPSRARKVATSEVSPVRKTAAALETTDIPAKKKKDTL